VCIDCRAEERTALKTNTQPATPLGPHRSQRSTHHAAPGPHAGGCDVGHNHDVGQISQAGLDVGLVLKHIQAFAFWGLRGVGVGVGDVVWQVHAVAV